MINYCEICVSRSEKWLYTMVTAQRVLVPVSVLAIYRDSCEIKAYRTLRSQLGFMKPFQSSACDFQYISKAPWNYSTWHFFGAEFFGRRRFPVHWTLFYFHSSPLLFPFEVAFDIDVTIFFSDVGQRRLRCWIYFFNIIRILLSGYYPCITFF